MAVIKQRTLCCLGCHHNLLWFELLVVSVFRANGLNGLLTYVFFVKVKQVFLKRMRRMREHISDYGL